MIAQHLSLKVLIPLLVIMLMLPFGMFVIMTSNHDAQKQLANLYMQVFQEKTSHLAVALEQASVRHDNKAIQRIISLASANSMQQHIAMIDPDGIILSSSHFAWEGTKAEETIAKFNQNIFKVLTKDGKNKYILHPESNTIYSYYPILVHQHNQPHLKKNYQYAVLYAEFNFRTEAANLESAQQEKFIIFIIGLILISLALIIVLRQWLGNPLKNIIAKMDHIQIDEELKLNVKGSREIMRLSDTLSNMHRSLQTSQAALNHTHALLTNLLNSVPDLIFYKDNEGVYLGCNQAFCHFVGKNSEKDIIGITDFDLFDKKLAKFFRKKDQSMLKSCKEQRNEEWVTYPNGQRVLLDTLKTPYYDKQQNIIGVIGISRDITATTELEDQFNQAQKMEAIGALVGGIAHDFNNVLAGITGNLYLAKKKLLDSPEVAKKLTNIETLSLRAADMIKQLLTFARKDTVRMQALSLTSFINEAVKLLQTSVPENITFQEHFTTEPLFINGDVTQLQQVLMNLINNARDALEGIDNPCISIKLESFQPSRAFVNLHPNATKQTYAHICIQDNGCGIAKDKLKHVLEPFFTTKEQGQGTGLGLSMVFGAIKTHHGILTIDSTEGKGTTFHIYIPKIPAKDFTAAAPKHISKAKAHGELVLLVDDEKYVRETTAEVLETLGYKVLQAEDGLQAIDVFKKHQHDIAILILDVVMPKLGGVESAAHIRMINPNIPIIFATGYDNEQMLKLDNQASNSSILSKPIQFDALHQLIAEKLAPSR